MVLKLSQRGGGARVQSAKCFYYKRGCRRRSCCACDIPSTLFFFFPPSFPLTTTAQPQYTSEFSTGFHADICFCFSPSYSFARKTLLVTPHSQCQSEGEEEERGDQTAPGMWSSSTTKVFEYTKGGRGGVRCGKHPKEGKEEEEEEEEGMMRAE